MTYASKTTIAVAISLFSTLAAGQDTWTRVPALPKACYSKGETFDTDVEKAANDLQAAIYKQQETNQAVKEKLDALDGSVRQSRMMAFLQKDPAAAQKYMQDMAGGQKLAQSNIAVGEKREALRKEFDTLRAQYEADETSLGADTKRLTQSRSSAQDGVMMGQIDAGYAKLCAKWWTSPTNAFVTYLVHYKKFLVDEAIPTGVELARVAKLQFQVFGVPDAGYKSTADLEAVKEYLGEVRKTFGLRRSQTSASR